MDDIGMPPYESSDVEVWIHRELKNQKDPVAIASSLFKEWESGTFGLGAKRAAGHFCFRQGSLSWLAQILKADILKSSPVPWELVYKLIVLFHKTLSTEVADACVEGATADHQLHQLAVEAVSQKDPDKRWQKILRVELGARLQEAKKNRQQMIDDLKILRQEGMDTDVREGVGRLLSMFPEDKDGLTFARYSEKKGAEKTLHRLRQIYGTPPPLAANLDADLKAVRAEWPELTEFLSKAAQTTNLESAYNLSVGLSEMGLYGQALDVLRWHKKDWSIREEVWELELLIALRLFVEALSSAQNILLKVTEVEVVRASLYYSAHAYFGLNDPEQATAILKGLIEHDPLYRDASILLSEWSQRKP